MRIKISYLQGIQLQPKLSCGVGTALNFFVLICILALRFCPRLISIRYFRKWKWFLIGGLSSSSLWKIKMNVLPSLILWFQDLGLSIRKDYAFKQKMVKIFFLICISVGNFLSNLKEYCAQVWSLCMKQLVNITENYSNYSLFIC